METYSRILLYKYYTGALAIFSACSKSVCIACSEREELRKQQSYVNSTQKNRKNKFKKISDKSVLDQLPSFDLVEKILGEHVLVDFSSTVHFLR